MTMTMRTGRSAISRSEGGIIDRQRTGVRSFWLEPNPVARQQRVLDDLAFDGRTVPWTWR